MRLRVVTCLALLPLIAAGCGGGSGGSTTTSGSGSAASPTTKFDSNPKVLNIVAGKRAAARPRPDRRPVVQVARDHVPLHAPRLRRPGAAARVRERSLRRVLVRELGLRAARKHEQLAARRGADLHHPDRLRRVEIRDAAARARRPSRDDRRHPEGRPLEEDHCLGDEPDAVELRRDRALCLPQLLRRQHSRASNSRCSSSRSRR